LIGNLVHTRAGRLQQMYRALDTKILKECERRFAQHGLEATRQGSFACEGCASSFTEREAVGQLAPGPPFEAFDERV
jgi:hypothetical protein